MPNPLGCDLFIGKARDVCTLAGVLNCNAPDIAALIEIQNSVLIRILRFGYFGCLELDIERISVLEILNLHSLNESIKEKANGLPVSLLSVRPIAGLAVKVHHR